MNVEIRTEAAQFPEKGIHKWDFPCSVTQNVLHESRGDRHKNGVAISENPEPKNSLLALYLKI